MLTTTKPANEPPNQPLFPNATATVTLDGLGICGFNLNQPAGPRGDVAILRAPEHHFTIQVDDDRPRDLPDNCTIAIGAVDADETVLSQYPDRRFIQGQFDRTQPASAGTDNNIQDFRWMFFIEDTVAQANLPPVTLSRRPAPAFGLTFAYIYDAVFYAANLTVNPITILPAGQDPNGTTPTTIGLANAEVGADIVCKEGGFVIVQVLNEHNEVYVDNTGKEFRWELNEENKPHSVFLKNEEPQRLSKFDGKQVWIPHDARLYYEALGADQVYEIWSECPATPNDPNRTNGSCRCQNACLLDLSHFPHYNPKRTKP